MSQQQSLLPPDQATARLTIRGFTLVEVLVVLVIVSVLASIGLPLAEVAHRRQKEDELRRSLREIRNALDAYKKAGDNGRILRQADQSGYPPRLDNLVSGVIDSTDPLRSKLYFLRRLPRDPFAPGEPANAEGHWGKRSYASEADDPREGNDIYDVHSRSDEVGLNGVPYRKW